MGSQLKKILLLISIFENVFTIIKWSHSSHFVLWFYMVHTDFLNINSTTFQGLFKDKIQILKDSFLVWYQQSTKISIKKIIELSW